MTASPRTGTSTRIDATAHPTHPTLTAGLWLLLVISAVANTMSSLAGVPTGVHLGLGVLTAAFVSALVVLRLRGRR